MFALSTSWNASKHSQGLPIIEEILKLGFNKIELNFSLTETMINEIESVRLHNPFEITSLHNYCPIPEDVPREHALPDCFSLSSLDEEERVRAVELTLKTITTAHRLRAKVVVLHCGRVEIKDMTRDLIALKRQNLQNTTEFLQLRENFAAERKQKSQVHFQQLLKSMETLTRHAKKLRIRLGIENRFYYREIPSSDEMSILLETFDESVVCYWHDVGHAFIQEELQLIPKDNFLNRFANRLCGIHIHDIKDMEDHFAPGEGNFDFYMLKSFCRGSIPKVIEVHPKVKQESILKGREILQGVCLC